MEEQKRTYISVIISDYNRKLYILNALKSVIHQSLSRENYEIILIKNFADSNIDDFASQNKVKSLISQDISLSGKIREALSYATGNVICFLDDDDKFYENKLEYVYNKFKTTKNLVYLHNNFSSIDDNNQPIKYKNINPDFNISSISIRKDIINVDTLTMVSKSIDTLMYMYARESGMKIEIDDTVLTYYRVTENSVTHSFNSIESFREFSINSLSKILQSYVTMKSIFTSGRALKIINHRESFTRIRINLFGGPKPFIKDYIKILFTGSMEPRSYEFKVMISSIFFKNLAMKKLYNNEMEKNKQLQ